MAARMAARGRVIVATFISCALVLPLLASATFAPSESGLRFSFSNFFDPPSEYINDPPNDGEDGSPSYEAPPENGMSYGSPPEEGEVAENAKIEQPGGGYGVEAPPESKPVENEGHGGEAKPAEGKGEVAENAKVEQPGGGYGVEAPPEAKPVENEGHGGNEVAENAKVEQPGGGYGVEAPPESKPVENEGHGGEAKPAEGKGEAKPAEVKGEAVPPVGKGKECLFIGFYEKHCPQAEQIVNEVLMKNLQKDVTLAPAIVRLFSHDCLVKGCDASILLDETPTGEDVEKKASQNGRYVRGYEVIDEMKERLEAECPGIVSCADIIAFANRDSLVYTGLPTYKVAAGRRDGLSSLAVNAQDNLPGPNTPVQKIIDMFQRHGLTLEDLVVLVGAHSIGTVHCGLVKGRLFDRNKTREIEPNYAEQMRFMCERDDTKLPFDPVTQNKMDSRIYNELLAKKALLESDSALANDPHGNDIMKKLASDQAGWFQKFIRASIKMGEIEVLTGKQGEIRKQCRAVN